MIVPALLDLCRDPVSAVRKVAASQVGPVLARVGGFRRSGRASEPPAAGSRGGDLAAVAEASKALRDFAFGSYRSKQMFAEVCLRMMDHVPRDLFLLEFAPMLLALSEVPNVRAALAGLLHSRQESLGQLPGGAHALTELGNDHEFDVAFSARFGAPAFVGAASEGGEWEKGGGGERLGGAPQNNFPP